METSFLDAKNKIIINCFKFMNFYSISNGFYCSGWPFVLDYGKKSQEIRFVLSPKTMQQMLNGGLH